jgi:hypothetical protein
MENNSMIPVENEGQNNYLYVDWFVGQQRIQFKVLVVFYVFDFDEGFKLVHGAN